MSYNNELNSILTKYCLENNIDIDAIKSSNMMDNVLIKKINPILSRYGMSGDTTLKEVYIKDIIGQLPNCTKNDLFEILNDSFSDSGNSYNIRNNDKLRLSKEEMIESIKSSQYYDPIILKEVDGKYVVSVNGCHRTAMLKLFYIDDLLKNGDAKADELNEKYKIKCKVETYDYTMSYINYMLHFFEKIQNLEYEYDKLGKKTGSIIIDGNVYTKDGVINYFTSVVNNPNYYDIEKQIRLVELIESSSTFKKFVKEYVALLEYYTRENKHGIS